MTRDEARQVLRVDADVSAEDLRRAYTRGVKQHKPDRDPDGFRRVREAFELLKTSAESAAAVASLAAPSDTATPEDAELATAQKALIERLGSAHDPEIVAARLREHLIAFPRDDRARRIAIDELALCGRHLDALKVVREGITVARVPLLFVRELAAQAPRELTPEQIDQLAADPESAPWAVMALIALGELERGQTVAFEALERAHGRRARIDWLRTIAAMYEHGAAPLARATLRELDRRIPDDVTTSEDPARIPTLLLRELGDVSGEIDKDVVRTLGAFIRSPSRGSAMLTALPPGSEALAKSKAVLRARAPTLTRFAFPELAGGEPIGSGAPRVSPLAMRLIAFGITALVSTIGGRQACSLWQVDAPGPTRVTVSLPGAASPTSTSEGRALCAALGEASATCARVHAAETAIDRLDCASARAESDAVVSVVFADHALSRAASDAARALRARVSDRCAGITSEPQGTLGAP